MIQISNIKLGLDEDRDSSLFKYIKKQLKTENFTFKIVKESIDARKKPIVFVYQVNVETSDEQMALKFCRDAKKVESKLPEPIEYGDKEIEGRVVVVGLGPAGLFAGLELARNGYQPIVFERGKDVINRKADVDAFWKEGILNEESNVQFGEGGAGTFSDGKLTTRIKDTRVSNILNDLHKFGASEEIVYAHKPHIGTDILIGIVKNIREEIVRLGGEVYFDSKVEDFIIQNGEITDIVVNGDTIKTNAVLLATGHSARDTVEILDKRGVFMTSKPFAVGFRIEHPQVMIDKSQYKELYDHPKLKSAEYHLTNQCKNGRSCYTFCMCPGGKVIGSSSECGKLVVNGMSYNARDLENANSAILCSVSPEDFGENIMDGINFQRKIETKAFELGGGNYFAPVQRVEDFLLKRETSQIGEVTPTYTPGYRFARLDKIYPEYITEAISESINSMARRLKGFDLFDAILTGVETRSSSPVRINRTPECESVNTKGLYLAGEGAGYAGGIVSAAVDGLRVSEALMKKYKNR